LGSRSQKTQNRRKACYASKQQNHVRLDGSNHSSEARIDQCAVEIIGEFFGFKIKNGQESPVGIQIVSA
jgi:hypothetical protein